jgi:Family of unknown function (DUF6283)
MAEPTTVRPTPCKYCPYRCDVPSGMWAAEEYEKLTRYDGEIIDQALAGATKLFRCHLWDEQLCAGWVGCHDMRHLLAARLHTSRLDPSVFNYASPVPVFASGAAAAEHGLRDIETPSAEALEAMERISRIRLTRGKPLS